ncbi:MAG: hypothetical protein DLM64_08485 [Solirubrobacterales bacterium]|nr:MAG: hypothetical protein DLM64_08485 [Solirubrobacterales bacterium]
MTAAVTALLGHHSRIGVVIGSNVFSLAALLGLAAVVAGEIPLHRRVIALEGTVAMLIAAVCFSVAVGGPGPGVGLLTAGAVLTPYLVVSGVSPERLADLGLPRAWTRWLSAAVADEDGPPRPPSPRPPGHRNRRPARTQSPP